MNSNFYHTLIYTTDPHWADVQFVYVIVSKNIIALYEHDNIYIKHLFNRL